jgi:hypothetical protein
MFFLRVLDKGVVAGVLGNGRSFFEEMQLPPFSYFWDHLTSGHGIVNVIYKPGKQVAPM